MGAVNSNLEAEISALKDKIDSKDKELQKMYDLG